jgi:hypothetical protein
MLTDDSTYLPRREGQSSNDYLLRVILLVTSFLLVGPIGLLAGAYSSHILKTYKQMWLNLALYGAVFVGVLYVVLRISQLIEQIETIITTGVFLTLTTVGSVDAAGMSGWESGGPHKFTASLLSFWLLNTPLVPIGVLMWNLFHELWNFVRPRTIAEQVALQQQLEGQRIQGGLGGQSVVSEPPKKSGRILLGRAGEAKGQSAARAGIVRDGPWAGLDEHTLNQHVFVLGETGSGKTVTIKRLIYEVLKNTDRDVIFVDGKGELETAQEVQALCYEQGRGVAPIFRLGESATTAYNGFIGDKVALVNRLLALTGVAKAETAGEAYWAGAARTILRLICYAPEGPPRSFAQLSERLSLNWLLNTWGGSTEWGPKLKQIKDEHFNGLLFQLSPLLLDFEHLIRPEGFVLEEARAAIFSLRTLSYSDTGKSLLRFLIEDLKDFAGNRQTRPALLVIDEFGAFGSETIIDLLAQARSAQLSIVLATQTTASLGDVGVQDQVLGSTITSIVLRTKSPERVVETAGTRRQPEYGLQIEDGKMSGLGTVRWQYAHVIPMDAVRHLQAGEGFIIRNGCGMRVQISKPPHVAPVPVEALPSRTLLISEKQVGEKKIDKKKRDVRL